MALVYFVLDLAVHDDAIVRRMARKALSLSTAVWFVFDTGFSQSFGDGDQASSWPVDWVLEFTG